MADLSTMRSYRHTWGRLTLALFVVSWMSVSLQPCLMAMEPDGAMQMAMQAGESAHAMHAEEMASSDADANCPNCPPGGCVGMASCDVEMSTQCQPDVQFSLDSRPAKLKLKDAKSDVPLGVVAAISDTTFAAREFVLPAINSSTYIPRSLSPLNVLYCVYLI